MVCFCGLCGFLWQHLSILYEGYSESFVLGKEKTPNWIFYVFYLFGVVSFMLDAYTHCKTYNPILTFLCALLLCINYLYGYQSTCVIQLMLFDLKNIVKFRRNEKKVMRKGRGWGWGEGVGWWRVRRIRNIWQKLLLKEEFRNFFGFGPSLNIIMQKGKRFKINTWFFFDVWFCTTVCTTVSVLKYSAFVWSSVSTKYHRQLDAPLPPN